MYHMGKQTVITGWKGVIDALFVEDKLKNCLVGILSFVAVLTFLGGMTFKRTK